MFFSTVKNSPLIKSVVGGAACIGVGYGLRSLDQTASPQARKKSFSVTPIYLPQDSSTGGVNLHSLSPLKVNAHSDLQGNGVSKKITAASVAATLVANIVRTHTKSGREPLDFQQLFNAAKIIRQSTLKNDGSRYKAFAYLCEELKHRYGHKLIDSEFNLLKELIFGEISTGQAEHSGTHGFGAHKTEELALKRVAATIWKKNYPTLCLPEWLSDIGSEIVLRDKDQVALPEQLISSMDEQCDLSNQRQMAANLYHAGLADISTVSNGYEKALLKLQQYLSHSTTQSTSKSPHVVIQPTIGFFQIQSPYHTVEDIFGERQLDLHAGPGTLISLCDGHGGDHIAEYLTKNFPSILASVFSADNTQLIEGSKTGRNPAKPGQLMKGTEQAFQHMMARLLQRDQLIDNEIREILGNESVPAKQRLESARILLPLSARETGSTALFVLAYEGRIAIFYAGDTRATIVKTMTIEGEQKRVSIAATEDHKPEIPRVYRHIKRLGGFITRQDEDAPYRVDGNLAVGRGFGDHNCHAVQAIPTVTILPPGVDHLVLATDGLWDVIPSWTVGPLLDILNTYLESSEEKQTQVLDKTVTHIMNDIGIDKLGINDPQCRKVDIEDANKLKKFLADLRQEINTTSPLNKDAFLLAKLAKFLGSDDDITVAILELKDLAL